MKVLAPCAGRLLPITDVPDPVFAGEIVGPGVAIDPEPGPATVVSPIAGQIVKAHPHAFVVLGSDEPIGVLVHLGIDTVKLDGRGFELLVEEGATVEAGEPVVRWDPSTITGTGDTAGMSPVVPVVVMDRAAGSLDVRTDGMVAPGVPLFDVG